MLLKYCEKYGPVLQGEGVTLGVPVLFLRLANCNLHCKFCDSWRTWHFEGTSFNHDYANRVKREDEVHDISCDEILAWIKESKCNRVVISGGEPMIQQKALTQIISRCKQEISGLQFETETNGTLMPTDAFLGVIDQINCSPKTQNSGNDARVRFQQKALEKIGSFHNSWFKFVVEKDEDIDEIMAYDIPAHKIMLMPMGHTRELQMKNLHVVEKLCLKHKLRLSPRLHVLMYDNKQAV